MNRLHIETSTTGDPLVVTTLHHIKDHKGNGMDLSQVKCFDCGEPGHYRANCPNKKSIDKDKDTRAKEN